MQEHWLPCNVDLGLGVLDAFVETALTVVTEERPQRIGIWLRLVDVDRKADELLNLLTMYSEGRENSRVFVCDQATFTAAETRAFSYWVPKALLDANRKTSLSSLGFEAKQGLATKDNFRFLRLHWEVSSEFRDRWRLYSKGGAYAPLGGTYHLVIDWGRAARVAFEKRDGQFCCPLTGQSARYALRPAVTYSQRTSRFSARVLPENSLFDKGLGCVRAGSSKCRRWR